MLKNDWMRLESRMEARFSTFSTLRCDPISISCMRRVELIGYFVCFGWYNTLAHFTDQTKAYEVIVSHTVQLWLFFKKLFLFVCLNSIVEQYIIIAKLEDVFMIHLVYLAFHTSLRRVFASSTDGTMQTTSGPDPDRRLVQVWHA